MKSFFDLYLDKKTSTYLSSETEKIYQNISQKIYNDRLEALEKLEQFSNHDLVSNERFVELHSNNNSKKDLDEIDLLLKKFIPWKKGPFKVNSIEIDSEWRSDLKWNRLLNSLPDMKDKLVLDVGCNNGYFLFKILEQAPRHILGIDPVLSCLLQYKAILALLKERPPISFELLGHQHLPYLATTFDVIFHMGIIYHHKNPIAQILDLRNALRPGGTLIIETINIPGEESYCLFPEDRYAKMRNIWFVPTTSCLINWLQKCKFKNIEIIFDELLTNQEQRVTSWSGNQSLDDFLDPSNKSLTIEGHPAPRRLAIKANI